MRYFLLGFGATALAGLTAGAGAGAPEWDVGIGGYYNALVGYGQTEVAGRARFEGADTAIDAQVYFLPSIQLDDEITLGAVITLDGAGDTDASAYAFGPFGEILLGSESSAGTLMQYSAPNVSLVAPNASTVASRSLSPRLFVRWATDFDSAAAGTLGTTFLEVAGNAANRITYLTPRRNGARLGVSYARSGERRVFGPADISTELGHVFDVGANYERSFGGLKVKLSGRWGVGQTADGNPTVWATGLNISHAGVTVGGSFAEANDHNGGVDDGTAFDIGIRYDTHPWKFSLTWFHGENREGSLAGFALGDMQDTLGAGIDYQLAEGVRLNLFGIYIDAAHDIGFRLAGRPVIIRGISARGFVVGTGLGLEW